MVSRRVCFAEELLMAVPYAGKNAPYAILMLIRSRERSRSCRKNGSYPTNLIPVINGLPGSSGIRKREIIRDGIRIGIFELSEDGCQLARWVGVS